MNLGESKSFRSLNDYYRRNPWPPEHSATTHKLFCSDARDLSDLRDESVHLIVTSPPYWTLKEYPPNERQLGAVEDYEKFLTELDRVWSECVRVLIPGGRLCCVVGDVCIPRERRLADTMSSRFMPTLQSAFANFGLDSLTPILWFKIANGARLRRRAMEQASMESPIQPGAIVKNDFEYILFFRKGGTYRSPSTVQKALSMLSKDEMKGWLKTAWTDIKGESTRRGHPAPFPVELAERLIRLFSFAGDIVLDPFVGTGTTTLAAMNVGRSSIGTDCDPNFVSMARERLLRALLSRPEPQLFEPRLDIQSP